MRKYGIHLLLFVITCITTTLAGAEWIYGKPILGGPEGEIIAPWFSWDKFWGGTLYSIPFLTFLTCHEFGHYFMARFYRVRVSLPFYIPLWFGLITSIGTMGAFIQIKERLHTRKEFFDIGIAGPLAGFIIALGVLIYGYTHLPPPEYVLEIHPEYVSEFPEDYARYGFDYSEYAYRYPDNKANREAGVAGEPLPEQLFMAVGKNLLMLLMEQILVDDPSRIPHPYEMM
ncbi:MAG: site-2 protease family protein, partial [Bacteroidota bacterium]